MCRRSSSAAIKIHAGPGTSGQRPPFSPPEAGQGATFSLRFGYGFKVGRPRFFQRASSNPLGRDAPQWMGRAEERPSDRRHLADILQVMAGAAPTRIAWASDAERPLWLEWVPGAQNGRPDFPGFRSVPLTDADAAGSRSLLRTRRRRSDRASIILLQHSRT